MEEKREKIINELSKEKYISAYKKQAKLAKKILLSVFLCMGFIFVIIGILLGLLIEKDFFAFAILGLFLIILGLILFFIIPENVNYEKQVKRMDKYGYVNIYHMNARIQELSYIIEELEKKNKILEDRIIKLEEKN